MRKYYFQQSNTHAPSQLLDKFIRKSLALNEDTGLLLVPRRDCGWLILPNLYLPSDELDSAQVASEDTKALFFTSDGRLRRD